MATGVTVSCTVLYIVVDSIITTVLYIHGSQLSIFTKDSLHFNIFGSALDLWGTVLLRASLLLGASIGVSWNKKDGPRRVARSTTIVLFTCMLVMTFALAKLLMLSEQDALSHQYWLLSLICWTCTSSLCVVLLWRQLGRESHSVNSPDSRSGGGGRGSEDTEKLVETAGEEEEERKEKGEASSGATLGRLLTYCRDDSGLLSVAVLFLLVSAVCKYP